MLTALGRIIQAQQPDDFEPENYMVSPNADPATKLKAAVILYNSILELTSYIFCSESFHIFVFVDFEFDLYRY